MTSPRHVLACLLVALTTTGPAWDVAADEISYFNDAARLPSADWVVVDTRPAAACEKASLPGARCLPSAGLLGPHGRLPSFADIAWVLGTVGLRGDEAVLVAGGDATARDFVAGLLYVMGQKRIGVLTAPVTRRAGQDDGGVSRGNTRAAVYAAPARADAVVFGRDLATHLASDRPPMVLDGRGEDEYWGARVRASRGGHLPGADHLSAVRLRAALARGEKPGSAADGPLVVYGHDAREGLAYLTLVRAGLGRAATVYPGGWAEWAAGALPADAATYPDRAPGMAKTVSQASAPGPLALAAAGLGLLATFAIGFLMGRRRIL